MMIVRQKAGARASYSHTHTQPYPTQTHGLYLKSSTLNSSDFDTMVGVREDIALILNVCRCHNTGGAGVT